MTSHLQCLAPKVFSQIENRLHLLGLTVGGSLLPAKLASYSTYLALQSALHIQTQRTSLITGPI